MTIVALPALKAALGNGQRLLGVDLGEKNIGLALSDTHLTVATPLETLKRTKFTVEAARIKELLVQHNIGGVVVGFPRNMDGSEGPAAQSARAFARNLAAAANCPIALWDERMSTMAVTRTLLDADASRKRRAEVVDKMAASYILQGALDWLKHNAK